MLYLSFCFALRRGEILGLQTKDINHVKRTLTISRSVVKDKESKYKAKPPKTRSGTRTLAVPNILYNLLCECLPDEKSDLPNWVFAGRFDKMDCQVKCASSCKNT